MLEREYIIVRGPMGVGKSTVMKGLFQKLHTLGIPRAYLGEDSLRRHVSDRRPTRENRVLTVTNIVCMANNFLKAGYFTMIEGVFAEQDLLVRLKGEIHGGYLLVRLDCDPETCYTRDASPGRPVCGREKIDLARSMYEMWRRENPEERVIDNTNMSVDDMVDVIVKDLGVCVA